VQDRLFTTSIANAEHPNPLVLSLDGVMLGISPDCVLFCHRNPLLIYRGSKTRSLTMIPSATRVKDAGGSGLDM
jgi:hypothetical protein